MIAIRPWQTIAEMLEIHEIPLQEFMEKMEFTTKELHQLVSGKMEISGKPARNLTEVFGVPASFWENLDKNYREKLKRTVDKPKAI